MKKCITCKVNKHHTDYSKLASSSDGRQQTCKQCNKAYYKANQEKIREKQNEYYVERYYPNNKDKKIQQRVNYYAINPEYREAVKRRSAANMKKYYQIHRDTYIQHSKDYYKKNSGYLNALKLLRVWEKKPEGYRKKEEKVKHYKELAAKLAKK